jgi:hypothetical protein
VVSIRRICAGPGKPSKTLIWFSKDLYYEWPTNDYEHEEIRKIFLQDKPREGIINDFNNHFKAFFDNDK